MNLKGGYKIIDLTGIEIEVDTETPVEITNPSILEQFYYLHEKIIDESKELKPIYIRWYDENDITIVSLCRISYLGEGSNAFQIETIGSFSLNIHIEFEYDSDNEKWVLSVVNYSCFGLEKLIANEVNTGISDNLISVGVKLYKHNLLSNWGDGGTVDNEWYIISTRSTPITSFYDVGALISIGGDFLDDEDNRYRIIGEDLDSDLIFVVRENDNSYLNIDTSALTINVDTVNAL